MQRTQIGNPIQRLRTMVSDQVLERVQTVSGRTVDVFIDEVDGNVRVFELAGDADGVDLANVTPELVHGKLLFVNVQVNPKALVEVLTAYLLIKKDCPSVSACFLLPSRRVKEAEWDPLVRSMRMKRIAKMPAGTCLHLTADGMQQPHSQDMCIMYDAPWHQVDALLKTIQDAVARNGLFMQCSGFLTGARVQALFDTGAEQSFVSTSFLKKAGLGRKVLGKDSPAVATAANGSAVQIEGEVTCKLNIWGHVSKVRCLVADLGVSHELILGQPWLQKQQAVLSYGSLQVAVGAIPSKRVVLQCNSTELRGCDGTSSGNAQPATETAGAADDRGADCRVWSGSAHLCCSVQAHD